MKVLKDAGVYNMIVAPLGSIQSIASLFWVLFRFGLLAVRNVFTNDTDCYISPFCLGFCLIWA